ncbi:actin-like protein arp8 [Microbotryomycetes sp. JL201]|nr:actin-like protein arp8 [Microbotryomycetes sp. JL201]
MAPAKGARRSEAASAIAQANSDLTYTTLSLTPLPVRSAKHVASNFLKSDTQSWFARRTTDALYEMDREAKRRRLMASEDEIQEAMTQQGVSDGPALNARASKPKLNVLAPRTTAKVVPAVLSTDQIEASATDEPELDPTTRTIIIQPGSRWLRIGRASDAAPTLVPNIIARRMPRAVEAKRRAIAHSASVLTSNALPALPSKKGNEDEEIDELADSDDDEPTAAATTMADQEDPLTVKINSIRVDLRQRMRAMKLRGTTGGNQIAAEYNATVEPQVMYNDPEPIAWIDAKAESARQFYVGQEALAIPDAEGAGYMLRRPYDRGRFNTGDYAVPQEIIGDIETIYATALERDVRIPRSDWPEYSVIFLIPDLYDHVYVREMTDLLLKTMGFKQICVQQESLSASIGAGSSSSCVVDIGARQTTVTCIEDGMVIADSRMALDFGGDDITRFLLALLVRTNFPYKEADLTRWHDFRTLELLKEQIIVLGENDVGVNLVDFYARTPDKPLRKYSIRYYDDAILAPYALFAPRVVDFDSKIEPQKVLWHDDVDEMVDIGSSDTTQAMTNSVRHLLPAGASIAATLRPAGQDGTDAQAQGSTVDVRTESSKIPLDVAVVESVLACVTEDRMKKVVANLVVTGGSGAIHNVGFAISSRVSASLASRAPTLAPLVNVVVPPKDMDTVHLAWKGMANLAKLPVIANDLWVRQDEWAMLGMKALKERVFYWA